MTSAAALLRFQAASSVRVGLRLLTPGLAVGVVTLGLQQYPGLALARLAAALAGPTPSAAAWGAVAAMCVAIAVTTGPLIASVERGWITHLPATRADRRLARIAGMCLVQSPLVVLVSVLVVHENAAWLPVAPVIALVASVVGSLPRRRHRAPTFNAPPRAFAHRFFVRTVGWRVAEAWLLGALPLGAAALFVHNNVLDARGVRLGATFGGTAAAATILAILGLSLMRRRPSWAWARSLPVSSRRRVVSDALLVAAHAGPAAAVTALLDPLSGALVAAAVPWMALRAAAAMRRAGRPETEMTLFLAEGVGASALIALVPWLALAALAGLPAAIEVAARRDRAWRVA
jgi:hypothetical protein